MSAYRNIGAEAFEAELSTLRAQVETLKDELSIPAAIVAEKARNAALEEAATMVETVWIGGIPKAIGVAIRALIREGSET